MSPMPPCEDGEFQMTRIALTRLPNSSTSSASVEWIAALWPRPSNSTIASASCMPCSRFSARMTARTGQSFSRVRGSCGPTPETSARMIEASSETVKPAISAMRCGLWPTTAALSFASAQLVPWASTPKMRRSSLAFSSGVARWACRCVNSASASS